MIDKVLEENKFQASGMVDDSQISKMGRLMGANLAFVTNVTPLSGGYYISFKLIDVLTGRIERQQTTETRGTSREIMDAVQEAVGEMLGVAKKKPVPSAAGSGSQILAQSLPAQSAAALVVSTPSIEGSVVPGTSLADKFAWLQRSADSHGTYILEVSANENIAPHTFEYRGAINVTVVLRGVGANRTVRLNSNGTMFTVHQNVTFILDNNITLRGHSQNAGGSMVIVEGGIFKMNTGATIAGNNESNGSGSGVYVRNGTFEMSGGTISGNSASQNGGGVYNSGMFTMSGGTISGNTASENGGGVYNEGTFTMSGGIILGNTAKNGGGVSGDGWRWSRNSFTITMRGGTITGNTASESGGGVYGSIIKTGGTITGYKSDPSNGNVVKDAGGDIPARKGHAIYISEDMRRETTAGPGVRLDSKNDSNWGEQVGNAPVPTNPVRYAQAGYIGRAAATNSHNEEEEREEVKPKKKKTGEKLLTWLIIAVVVIVGIATGGAGAGG